MAARIKHCIFAAFIIIGICISTLHVNAAGQIALAQSGQKQNRAHSTNDLYKSYLEFSAYRNKILSQNLANVNTPGYKADEAYIPSNLNDLGANSGTPKKVTMARTSAKHISKHNANEARFRSHKLEDPDEVKKNGNNVSLRQQMVKLSQNKTDYTAAVKGYATSNALLSSIIGK